MSRVTHLLNRHFRFQYDKYRVMGHDVENGIEI